MDAFRHEFPGGKVLFGVGTLDKLADEARAMALERLLVLSTPEQVPQAEQIASRLGLRCAGVFTEARMHTPVEVTNQAVVAAKAARADGVVAVGGGSTTGLGKAIALRTDLPQIVIPTTYAGSETTPILGETVDGLKTTIRSSKVLPELIIYDVALTFGLPVAMSVTSGFNAIAHAAEALYAEEASPIIRLMAQEGVRALASALPRIARTAGDVDARSDALYGAWLCGVCLGTVGMALHHKLCHTLGGTFDLPHADLHTVLLPHALAYNLPAAPEAARSLAAALGGGWAPQTLYEMARSLGAPISLRAIGMPESGIVQAAELAVQNPYWNPRPIEGAAVRGLLKRAWAGDPPAAGGP
jgi:alcohol dehydrogenase class IV